MRCLWSKSLRAVVTCRSRKTLGRGLFLRHASLAAPHYVEYLTPSVEYFDPPLSI